ncbi:MAG: hypothetical protein IEMM0003_0894 [bacterium]|nr:MAG: hypothetical protein IEMM0003_0894 [bacterium]
MKFGMIVYELLEMPLRRRLLKKLMPEKKKGG